MNNKNWIGLFFGLACLVLLVGVVSVTGTMNNNTGRNNTTPQQINQNLMTDKPKDGNLPTEINANDMMNNTTSPSPSPSNTPDGSILNMNENNPITTPFIKASDMMKK